MKKIFFVMAVYSLTFIACHHKEQAHEGHEHAEAEETSANPEAIRFGKEQQEKIAFSVEHPVVEPFGQVIRTTALIQSSQTDETVVPARTSGIVLFSGNNITEGQSVHAGRQLFAISGDGMAVNNANVRFVEAKNNYRQTEAAYKRAGELVKTKIISEKDFLQAQTDYETAKAVYDNLYKNFNSKGQAVTVAFDGYIKQLFVENGQYVEEGQALLSLSKNKSLILKADVSPKYAGLLHLLSSATIRTTAATYHLEELNGKILSYGKSLNGDNYMIPVSLQIDNKAGFLPGGFVEVCLKTRSENPVMTIPAAALTEEQALFFVYVQLSPESFEKREVRIGVTDGIRTEILSGLDKTDKVVTKGAVSVKLAQASGALNPHAGHVH
ncbi:MAG: efflux RND transporter periplasmic adaptor subunit [Candidatus Symbiothrix sp.]|jgi:RND family efflux transporter MFP subunit|nr:efflux RND transporter periplasmic adaptor subunit [Candidatus Symbiothrix sp.]